MKPMSESLELEAAKKLCRKAGFYVIPAEAIRTLGVSERLSMRHALDYRGADLVGMVRSSMARRAAELLLTDGLVTFSEGYDSSAPMGAFVVDGRCSVIVPGDYANHPMADPILEVIRRGQRGD